ncbi:MAG: hypothetical protein SWN10_18165 [Pseudomonadota bacterium]|nr:hypothetical protein [Pseudomonadota bacterium]
MSRKALSYLLLLLIALQSVTAMADVHHINYSDTALIPLISSMAHHREYWIARPLLIPLIRICPLTACFIAITMAAIAMSIYPVT